MWHCSLGFHKAGTTLHGGLKTQNSPMKNSKPHHPEHCRHLRRRLNRVRTASAVAAGALCAVLITGCDAPTVKEQGKPSQPAAEAVKADTGKGGGVGAGARIDGRERLAGEEKFASMDVTRNTTDCSAAETFIQNPDGSLDARLGPEGRNAKFDNNGGTTAKWVYHSPLAEVRGEDGKPIQYLFQFSPKAEGVVLWIECSKEGDGSQAFCYYTVDGSEPSGAGGVGEGTTKTAPLIWRHNAPSVVDKGVLNDWWATDPISTGGGEATFKYKIGFSKSKPVAK